MKKVYYSQLQARNWKPAQSSKTNFFTASSGPASSVIDKQSKSLPPGFENHSPRFVKWFLSRKCSICGKNHPDKFHNDPDMINCPFKKSDRPPARSLPSGQSQPKSGFKLKPGKNKEFTKRVYQVASDCIEDFKAPDDDYDDDFEVEEYVANMADDDGDEPGYEHVDDDGDDDHEDSAAMALAALALQVLSIN